MTPRYASWPKKHASSCSPFVALAAIAAMSATAAANTATRATPIVGAVAGPSQTIDDVRLIGPSGEVYQPKPGNPQIWQRQGVGGVAATVRFAGRHAATMYAAGSTAPIYVRANGIWFVHPLPSRGRATLATAGPVGAAVVGRQVFTLAKADRGWRRFGRTKGRVTSVWAANAKTVYVANSQGRLRRGRNTGKNAASWTLLRTRLVRGDFVRALVGSSRKHLYALSQQGVLLRIRGTRVSRVSNGSMVVHTATIAADGKGIAAGRLTDGRAAIATIAKGRMEAPEAIPGMAPRTRLTVVIARGGIVVVATNGGQVFSRQGAAWTPSTLSAVPSPGARFPRAVPARTQ